MGGSSSLIAHKCKDRARRCRILDAAILDSHHIRRRHILQRFSYICGIFQRKESGGSFSLTAVTQWGRGDISSDPSAIVYQK